MTTTAPEAIHHVSPPPDRRKEEPLPYYEHAGDLIECEFGRRPSRSALYKYLAQGYPVARGGPCVVMPTFTVLKRPMTTRQAMQRWLSVVRKLEQKLGVAA